MSNTASEFVGNIPENYDQRLGPNIFVDYADDIVRRVVGGNPSAVLEIAAGTGIVSRRLRDALPASASLSVTDLNGPMLEIAKSKFSDDENATFQSADALSLPFDDNSFDAAICQFGLMFFPDKQASFAEVARVLKPGGTYLFNTWGTLHENPFSEIADGVAREAFPDDPPMFYKVPFSYHDAQAVQSDMHVGGLTDTRHEQVNIEKTIADITEFSKGLVFGNPLIGEIESRGGVTADEIANQIERQMSKAFGTDPSVMPLVAHVFSGKVP